MTERILEALNTITITDVVIFLFACGFVYKQARMIMEKINSVHDEKQYELCKFKDIEVVIKQTELLQSGVLSLLRFRLYAECEKHLKIGMISVQDMTDVRHLYESYRALGGNGTGDKLYKDVQKLPIKQLN